MNYLLKTILLSVLSQGVLPGLFQVVFDRITPDFLNFLKRKQIKESLFQQTILLLLSANDILSEAEKELRFDAIVKGWIDELRYAVYDTEDLLDTIVLEHELTIKGKLVDFLLGTKNLELINFRLTCLIERKDFFGLKEERRGMLSSLSLPTSCLEGNFEVFGRDGDKENIIRRLTSDNRCTRISVFAIVGMAGIGKTTLAQLLFNDSRVKGIFLSRYWVSVSEGSDVFNVTGKIFQSVTGSNSDNSDFNMLQVQLARWLRGRRFLLVLDNFRSQSFVDWDLLKRPLANGAYGSVILVTTRNENVALSMRDVVTYNLSHLSNDDCWNIFAEHAFGAEIADADPTLKEIGQKIVTKCGGLPLAAESLGGLLHSVSDAKEWDNILESKVWDLPAHKINILPAFRLSYQHLPYHLRRCFAYLSLFPKGYEIDKWDLIYLWMAEGLLPPSRNGKTMEKIGEEYINDLLSRSFLQPSKRKHRSMSEDPSFLMHHLISDMAQYAGGKLFYQLEDGDPNLIPKKVRHFSFLREKLDAPPKFRALHHLSQLRTFLPLSRSYSGNSSSLTEGTFIALFQNLSCLRVLSLSKYPINMVPSSIEQLKRLTYLNLSRTQIVEVPYWVASLHNLVTLLLNNCQCLKKLPTDLPNLTKLRHLDIRGSSVEHMPPEFNKLKFLQVLTSFFVGNNSGSRLSALGELSQLRGAISLVHLENIFPTDASGANLKTKKFLEELELKWTNPVQLYPDIVLKNLVPHMYLKRLKIDNYGGQRFPDWLGNSSFSYMVSVDLIDCRNCESLPPLGQLYSLKILKVRNMSNLRHVNRDFYGESQRPFRSLEELSFQNMMSWEEWQPIAGAGFPSLQRLHIRQCPHLRGDLTHRLPSLVKLEIFDCDMLGNSLPIAPILRELHISNCNALQSLSEVMLLGNNCLSKLKIYNCRNLQLLQSQHWQALEHLHMESSCNTLNSFPLFSFPALRDLHIQDCRNLEALQVSSAQVRRNLHCLLEIVLKNCPRLASFRGGALPTPNLKSISIDNCQYLSPQRTWGLRQIQSLVVKINGLIYDHSAVRIDEGLNSVLEEGLLPALFFAGDP